MTVYTIRTSIDKEYLWKLTVGDFIAQFSSLEEAEEEGRKSKKEFTIEHVIETREYFSLPTV